MVNSIRKTAIVALAVALGTFTEGCSSDNSPRGQEGGPDDSGESRGFGNLDLEFTVLSAFQVAAIHYDIVDTVTGLTVKSHTADVSSDDATASAFLSLPPGSYVANLTATGTLPCTGSSGVFNVVANTTITVPVVLACGAESSPATGGAMINGDIMVADMCGLTKMLVAPLQQGLGHNITTNADAQAFHWPTASYAWSSSLAIGTFADPASPDTVFTCNTVGATTLTLTLIDGTCTDSQAVDVRCVSNIVCGNAQLQPGEACDDGNLTPGDGCDATCHIEPMCGNGTLEWPEICDDGNVLANDGCSASCVRELCGDGIAQTSEQCDDGNQTAGDGCDASCHIEPVCGNATLEAPETCDDGNVLANDGCSASCALELCGDGSVQGSEECDDGNQTVGDGCDDSCFVEIACDILDLFVAPLQQGRGGNISVAATAQGSVRATFLWSSSSPIGSFGNATQLSTVFTCNAAGSTLLTFSVTDGACVSSFAIPVTCL